jgi:hypothetical protein
MSAATAWRGRGRDEVVPHAIQTHDEHDGKGEPPLCRTGRQGREMKCCMTAWDKAGLASSCLSKGSTLNLNRPADQAFFTYALHHPLTLTCFPPKIGHGPAASPGLP